ncbi:hypothetical protein NC796_11290 [Aliifodinibius sp. S!AR15-10]|uniref:hypothetical protein n=1 Tax=Aliifodinibius sp. S!AR15-10 TaxID=2950437 RepID=UPI00285FA663|nr:hypothetical protein [Aliifodinibius sp. S!AR15-10]MDR8391730.1 hypothetical protein [Aliifodinibius sp. S!AR15-10]
MSPKPEDNSTMKRSDFIKYSLGASVGSLAIGKSQVAFGLKRNDTIRAAISKANDRRVEEMLERYDRLVESSSRRGQSGFILTLASAYCSPDSEYYRSLNLVEPMHNVAKALILAQNSDGTFDFGNLQSPPDTAFMMEQLFRAQKILITDGSEQTINLRQSNRQIILDAAEALTTGGIHTPNHRWAVSAALSGINSLYPNQKYVNRINDWLGEGIGQDADGEHPERSRNYDAAVNNPSLLDVAIYQKRPELFDVISKNLELTIHLTELNGECETVASRRQDQEHGRYVMIHRYYLPFRYLAIRDNNPRFAAVANMIETKYMDTLGEHLADFLLHEELNMSLPKPAALEENYVKHFQNTHLVRIRRGNKTASVFGGTDWHLGYGAWSGISHNPTFFKFRNGNAILESVRMSPAFFRTGYFRSNGLAVQGNEYRLEEQRQVPYHQPLPEKFRNKEGVYKMSPDGRFYSKMDFENRPKDYKKLHSMVTVREVGNSGAFEMEFSVEETPRVPVTIELCFRKGGQLSGVIPRENDTDGYFLSDGEGSYKVGNDVITFGPGKMEHTRSPQSNEQYSVYNGDIEVEGYRVYITGITPFTHKIRIG